jgi:Fe-S cluster biosynthesis and repair protein YggX
MPYNIPNPDKQRTISINPATLSRLKKAYKEAVDKNQSQFMFEGNVLVTGYAKYLIQYMEMRLEK